MGRWTRAQVGLGIGIQLALWLPFIYLATRR